MLTLWIAGLFVSIGFATWILGYVTGHPDLSLIGCVIVLGLGVMALDGLYYKAGETDVTNAAGDTTVTYDYERVQTPNQFPLGALIMLLGGTGALHQLARFSES